MDRQTNKPSQLCNMFGDGYGMVDSPVEYTELKYLQIFSFSLEHSVVNWQLEKAAQGVLPSAKYRPTRTYLKDQTWR